MEVRRLRATVWGAALLTRRCWQEIALRLLEMYTSAGSSCSDGNRVLVLGGEGRSVCFRML
jgi:hypothetical protein